MRPVKSGKTTPAKKRAWQAPVVTRLAIGTETKSWAGNKQEAGRDTPNAGPQAAVQPEPPAAPATKLGFSFELSFPLSARIEK
jgi:hypothetical protein